MNDIRITTPKRYIDGVKPEVALAIAEMLKKGTRYMGSSGAGLTKQAFDPALKETGIDSTLAKIGLDGERETTNILKKWMKDKPNVVLVDSVHIRDTSQKPVASDDDDDDETLDEEVGFVDGKDTDHVMIIGDEVILIDTKRWKSKRNYSVGDNGEVLRANKSFPGGKLRMKEAIYKWLDYLDEDASITGIVHINAEETTVFRNRNWYTQAYRLVELDRFIELLDEKWKVIDESDKNKINSTLVSQIAINAIKPYDPRKRVLNQAAFSAFK